MIDIDRLLSMLINVFINTNKSLSISVINYKNFCLDSMLWY